MILILSNRAILLIMLRIFLFWWCVFLWQCKEAWCGIIIFIYLHILSLVNFQHFLFVAWSVPRHCILSQKHPRVTITYTSTDLHYTSLNSSINVNLHPPKNSVPKCFLHKRHLKHYQPDCFTHSSMYCSWTSSKKFILRRFLIPRLNVTNYLVIEHKNDVFTTFNCAGYGANTRLPANNSSRPTASARPVPRYHRGNA